MNQEKFISDKVDLVNTIVIGAINTKEIAKTYKIRSNFVTLTFFFLLYS